MSKKTSHRLTLSPFLIMTVKYRLNQKLTINRKTLSLLSLENQEYYSKVFKIHGETFLFVSEKCNSLGFEVVRARSLKGVQISFPKNLLASFRKKNYHPSTNIFYTNE